jgi:hypothetical protein
VPLGKKTLEQKRVKTRVTQHTTARTNAAAVVYATFRSSLD